MKGGRGKKKILYRSVDVCAVRKLTQPILFRYYSHNNKKKHKILKLHPLLRILILYYYSPSPSVIKSHVCFHIIHSSEISGNVLYFNLLILNILKKNEMHSYFNIFYHQHIVYLLDIRFNIYIYIYIINFFSTLVLLFLYKTSSIGYIYSVVLILFRYRTS